MVPTCKTLEEAWEVERQRFSDDIIQKAALKALLNGKKDVVRYFYKAISVLNRSRYNDGVDVKMGKGSTGEDGKRLRVRVRGVQFPESVDGVVDEWWGPMSHRMTPERIAILREAINAVDPQVISWAVDGTYVPYKKRRPSGWRNGRKKRGKLVVLEGRL